MQHTTVLLENTEGVGKPLFFWDDTALVGKSEALETAARIINQCSEETGLKLKWKKCHLYGSTETVEQCRTLKFPAELTMHQHFNMKYLKAPMDAKNGYLTGLKIN